MLKVTNDYVFKRIFGKKKNKELLKDLLQSILTDIKIDKIEVNHEVPLETQIMTNKLCRLDIMATLDNGVRVNIEMQVKNHKNTIERSIFYQSGMFHTSLFTSENYLDIPRNISIWILDYDVFEEGPFHEIARLKRDYEGILLTDKFEIHYIQLPKFKKKCKHISNKLEGWLTFFSSENLEEIKMINNEYVKKAEEELEYLTGDAAERRLAELRESAIRDYTSDMSIARKEGIQQGTKETQIEIAKKMLEKNTDINYIIEVTGLTKEEIDNL